MHIDAPAKPDTDDEDQCGRQNSEGKNLLGDVRRRLCQALQFLLTLHLDGNLGTATCAHRLLQRSKPAPTGTL